MGAGTEETIAMQKLTHKALLLKLVTDSPGDTASWYKGRSEQLQKIKRPNWHRLIDDLVRAGKLRKSYGHEEGSEVRQIVLFPVD